MVIRVSLKEALRERPGAPGAPKGTIRRYDGKGRVIELGKEAVDRAVRSLNYHATVTCTPMWEASDLRTFSHLVDMVAHPSPGVDRILAQSWLDNFKRKHGVEKCDMMLAELRRRDAAAWFKNSPNALKGA